MPGWLISALTLLRGATVGTPARALVTGVGGGTLVDPLVGALGGAGLGLPSFLGGEAVKRRRRRRRALTASDRADIAFIEALLGRSAGQKFAVQLVTRTHR